MTPTPTQPESKDFSKEVAAVAQRIKAIRDIIQTRGTFQFHIERFIAKQKIRVLAQDEPQCRVHQDGTRIHVAHDFALRGVAEGSDDTVFEILATFSLRYELVDEEPLSPEVLQAVGELNGRFNLTAYWREYVQSCCLRCGLPPYPIEPFNAMRAISAGLKPKALPKPE